jgi:hypothetical protein
LENQKLHPWLIPAYQYRVWPDHRT